MLVPVWLLFLWHGPVNTLKNGTLSGKEKFLFVKGLFVGGARYSFSKV
jgi:hypothetical protein